MRLLATCDGQPLSAYSVGSAELKEGQTLATSSGKAELLLTPGVFLRVGEDSTVRMISPDLTHTQLALEHGRAELEVDQLHKEDDLLVDLGPGP